jgi:hypothetical protein
MSSILRKAALVGLLALVGSLGDFASSAQAQAWGGRVSRQYRPGRYYYPGRDYYFGSVVGPIFPTANSSYFDRDYLNRPMPRDGSGFVRDWSTARNIPYGKPWMRPSRR